MMFDFTDLNHTQIEVLCNLISIQHDLLKQKNLWNSYMEVEMKSMSIVQ